MILISRWASRHLWAARLLLVLLFALLNVLAFFTGAALAEENIYLPAYLLYLTALPVFLLWCTYPKAKAQQQNYWTRKSREGVLIVITFLQIVCIGNEPAAGSALWQPALAGPTPVQPAATVHPPAKKGMAFGKNLRKKLQQHLRQWRHQYQQASNGGKIALIILSVLMAAGLIMLLLALSCNIACAGSEAAALLLAVLGPALVIFLLVRIIRSLNRRYREKTGSAAPGI